MKESEGDILRPLLGFSKKEIMAFAKQKKLRFVEDKSNKDLGYARNRIRHKVIPELEKINPGLLTTLKTNIDLAREANQIIEKELSRAEKSVVKENTIDIVKLKKYDQFIQKEIIRRMLFAMTGKKEGIYFRNIEEVLKLSKSAGSKATRIGPFTIEKTYDKIIFGTTAPKTLKPTKVVPESTQKFGEFTFESRFGREKTRKNNILLPVEIAYNLNIRTWRAGDKIKTKAGTKKLQDVFTNGKIPLSVRKTWPVVIYKKQIVWVPLLSASSEYVSKNKKSLVIKVKINKG